MTMLFNLVLHRQSLRKIYARVQSNWFAVTDLSTAAPVENNSWFHKHAFGSQSMLVFVYLFESHLVTLVPNVFEI